MATKWKTFSCKKPVKVILLLAFFVCTFLIGFITAYIPINESDLGNTFNALFADDYLSSRSFGQMMEAEVENLNADSIKGTNNRYLMLKIGDEIIKNEVEADVIFHHENYNWTVTKFNVDSSSSVSSISNNSFLSRDNKYIEIEYIEIGFSADHFRYLEQNFNITQWNIRIVVLADIALFILSIVLMVLLCKSAGLNPDGSVSFGKLFRVYYEVILAIIAIFIFVVMRGSDNLYGTLFQSVFYSSLGSIILESFCGLITMSAMLLALWFFAGISVRRKNKCALNGSIIWIILFWIYKKIRLFGKCFKEIMTGEMYSSSSAAKKLIYIDLVFVALSIILAASVFASRNIYFLAPAILIEIVLFALFSAGHYFVLRDGALIEHQIKEMHSGNYDFTPTLSKNSSYAESAENLSRLAEQYRKGLEERVKAERMKVALVTNVSHDLKTPLTSIISYTDLLSKEELSPEAREYVEILQKKSERLKNIVSDVFELAKTTSGEIKVDKTLLDMNKLAYQTLGEMMDKINASGLEIKTQICEPPVTVLSDGKLIYRIIQNLLDNALKYSLKGTRIYFSLEKIDGEAVVTVKNIAKYEMNFTKEEVLERFSRGEKSRTTEGSGLGLSIAQGFAYACGGKFDVIIDGDMFKVILSLPLDKAGEDIISRELMPMEFKIFTENKIPDEGKNSDKQNVISEKTEDNQQEEKPKTSASPNEGKTSLEGDKLEKSTEDEKTSETK